MSKSQDNEVVYGQKDGKYICVFTNVQKLTNINFVANSEFELEHKIKEGYPMGLAAFQRARRLAAQKKLAGKPPTKMNKAELVELGKTKGLALNMDMTRQEMLDKLN